MSAELDDLLHITQARYQKAQSALQAVQKEETRLRGLLSELLEKERSGREAMSQDNTLQRTGGDVNWMRWVAHSRRILNMQLANVLVQKEKAFRELQSHFGKADVLEKLAEQEAERRRADLQNRQINAILDLELSRGK